MHRTLLPNPHRPKGQSKRVHAWPNTVLSKIKSIAIVPNDVLNRIPTTFRFRNRLSHQKPVSRLPTKESFSRMYRYLQTPRPGTVPAGGKSVAGPRQRQCRELCVGEPGLGREIDATVFDGFAP